MEKKKEIRQDLDSNFVAPLLMEYVSWILHEASWRGIHTLYFLARDGYILREIAQLLCRKHQLDIECRYLYCSRASLRMPSYHLIGEEALELLFAGGYQVTLDALLKRMELTKAEETSVLLDCRLEGEARDKVLTNREISHYREIFRSSAAFWEVITEKSERAYRSARAYFRQEGLLDRQTVAIVDSGWSGTMQRSLGQLLRSDGFRGTLTGFYFGMYTAPKEAADGTYLTFFFDAKHHKRNRVILNNNLFECLLSAPHGMTVGYEETQTGFVRPILCAQSPDMDFIESSIRQVLAQVEKAEPKQDIAALDIAASRRRAAKLVSRYMVRPTREEAAVLGSYAFCDDITEDFHFTLADSTQVPRLRDHLIFARILRKFIPAMRRIVPLYWPYGVIAFLPRWKRWWYRWNEYLWQWLRVLRHR